MSRHRLCALPTALAVTIVASVLPLFAAPARPAKRAQDQSSTARDASPANSAPGWYSIGGTWTNRKKITVDHTKVAGPLTNFPLLISMLDNDLRTIPNGGKVASASGADIVFTASDGVTKLADEIEAFNAAAGSLTAWVSVPQLPATSDTIIYVYFGNAASTGVAAASAVWDGGYQGVYHLTDPVGAGLHDSTANNALLTRTDPAHPKPDSAGRIAGAQQFAAQHSGFAMRAADDVQTGPTTLSFWVRRLEEYPNGSAPAYVVRSVSGSGDILFQAGAQPNSLALYVDGAYRTIAVNVDSAWNYVAVTRNGTAAGMYFNGKLAQSFTITGGATLAFGGLGSIRGTGSFYGELDEVRWSHVARAPEWIATEYANQSAPSNFYSVAGLEPTVSVPAGVAAEVYKSPDESAAAIFGTEDVSKRTSNARHFHNADGSWTALIGSGINQLDNSGHLAPVLPELWRTANGGWQWLAGPMSVNVSKTAKGHDVQHLYAGADGTQHAFTLSFPALTYMQRAGFTFTAGKLLWNLTLRRSGTDFQASVSAPLGFQNYALDYTLQGTTITVNALGDVVAADGTSLSRARMIRSDHITTVCSAWSADKKTLSFTCDDSSFPPEAYPYTIDPTVQINTVSNLKSCDTVGYNQPVCTPNSFLSCFEDDSTMQRCTASWTMDTSSIPSNATISDMTVTWGQIYSVDSYNITSNGCGFSGPNNNTSGTGGTVTFDEGYYNCNYFNPTYPIVQGGTTPFTGSCNQCGSAYDQNGNASYGSGQIGNFGIGVTYTVPNQPTPYTINTSVSGLTFTVDGTNYSSAQTFQWLPGTQHTIAIAGAQDVGVTTYVFSNWTDGGAATHTVTVGAANTTITANVTAMYRLTTAATAGGTVSPATGLYAPGAWVTVTATPSAWYAFSGFSGALQGTTNPQQVYMNTANSVTANFQLGYFPYYSDPLTSVSSNWTSNGTVSTGTSGLTSSDSNGGSLISTVAVPDGTSQYEVTATLALTQSGGTYVVYTRATTNARSGPTAQGTFYAAELQNPTLNGTGTLAMYKVINGAVTSLGTTTVPCHNGMILRVSQNNQINVYVDNELYLTSTDSSITGGTAGVGVRGAPSTSPTNTISPVGLYPLDRTAPNTIATNTIGTSAFANRVDIQWQQPADNPTGYSSGVAYYAIYRNNVYLSTAAKPAFSDETVNASTSYQYQIVAYDFDNNSSTTTVTVNTPPPGTVDPRRVGVRPNGAYWGGNGENVDLLSGNVNFTVPLLKAQGRGGWGVPFNLTYNSQNWRKDSGGVWSLGHDIGYGFGWKLLAGSLTPYWTGNLTIDHYIFTDASGAEYRLNQQSGNVWTSTEGIYISYDWGSNRLHFNDGSFWVMGCTSAGTEQDAGTMYPTTMEDSNGNQVIVSYAAGAGVIWNNSSGRIQSIEDVRGNGSATYQFTYTGGVLQSITNRIGTSEGYGFNYTSGVLKEPFSQTQVLPAANYLKSVAISGIDQVPNSSYPFSYQFTTDASGELTAAVFPYQGTLSWSYANFAYAAETQNELSARTLGSTFMWNGPAPQRTYPFSHDSGDGSRTLHASTIVVDPNGGAKKWMFDATSGDATIGLLLERDDFNASGDSTPRRKENYTWVNTSGNYYIGTNTETVDGVSKNTTQTLDQYGNVKTLAQYDWGNATSRTYTNRYLHEQISAYIPLYILNRPYTSQVTVTGGQPVTLFTNLYDFHQLTDIPNAHEHDSSYTTSSTLRGNLDQRTDLSGITTVFHDIGGNAVSGTNPQGVQTNGSYSSGSNYAAPSAITTNSLSESLTWSPFLGLSSATGPNGDSASTVYDAYARPASSTSPTGATTTYSYTNPNPSASAAATVAASVNGRVSTQYLDGFGRVIKQTSGYGTGPTIVSEVDTIYDACGCTPMGKMTAQSMPHANGATPVWTTYTYDGLGRTLYVTPPATYTGDASKKSYSYSGNTVTVADEAGKVKVFTMDGFGNLTTVVEDPTGVNLTTGYVYDVFNHLTGVTMVRQQGGQQVTQTRTFGYSGPYLTSAKNPENGEVDYTYSGAKLATKTDAKGQQTQYSYDMYGRLTQIRHYPSGPSGNEDVCQQVNYTYDTDAIGYSQYAVGRLTTKQYETCASQTPIAGSNTQGIGPTAFTEYYSYTQAGLVAKKKLRISRNSWAPNNGITQTSTATADLDGAWTYNTDGAVLTMTQPTITDRNGTALGTTYTYGLDSVGRLNTLTDGNSTSIVSGATYGPANEMLSFTGYGAQTRTYNTRLQLTSLSNGVSNFTYTYFPANNGKIQTETDAVSGEQVTYAYDSLNRLMSATSNGTWSQGFSYDGFANLTDKFPNVTGKVATTMHINFDVNNHQIGTTYDPNGNQVTDMNLLNSLQYDVENRMLGSFAPGGSSASYYAYDPSNLRVWAVQYSNWNSNLYLGYGWWSSQAETAFFYAPNGQKLGQYQLQFSAAASGPPYAGGTIALTRVTEPVYFGGQMIAKRSANGTYLSLAPNQVGSVGKYYPYGEERPGPTQNDTEKFGTYYRDQSTGLDYAMNRYYGSAVGRFMSPDPYRASGGPTDPGSWNRYSYTPGDPVNRFDPVGLYDCFGSQTSQTITYSGASGSVSAGDPVQSWSNCSDPLGFSSPGGLSFPLDLGSLLLLQGANAGYGGVVGQFKKAESYVQSVVAAADKALQNGDCAALFGNSTTRANGFDPTTIFNQLFSGLATSLSSEHIVGGTAVSALFTFGWTIGGSQAATTGPVPFLGIYAGQLYAGMLLEVDINVGEWDALGPASTSLLAAVLLHEMGHVYNSISGSGGSAVVDDTGNRTLSQQNTTNILKTCGLVY